PDNVLNFSIAVLKLIIDSSIDDEYIKQKSKNLLFHAELIDSFARKQFLTEQDKQDFMTLLINYHSLKFIDPQCSDFKSMISLLILLKNNKTENYESLVKTLSDLRKGFMLKKGFRYKYWLDKFIGCVDEINAEKDIKSGVK
ncbi:MAG: hypothetical protein KAR20_26150, partial [Candidatus Heimdallarchaeota archaeon]|nr:hypothetical protein [Candidatus Heimdallarchaeota archaeon]